MAVLFSTSGFMCKRCRLFQEQTSRAFIRNVKAFRSKGFQYRRYASQPVDNPEFVSVLDRAPIIMRKRRRHGPGLIILALMPITAFALGTWQVQRLGWKSEMIAKYEDRIIRAPLPLPPRIDPTVLDEFNYRRVYATGHLRHDQEMLIGPRMFDSKNGYFVITPLQRSDGASTILINRGWIPKSLSDQTLRAEGLPKGEVTVQGLLRKPWKKNMFTPDNQPSLQKFYFPDVEQMAKFVGAQPIWVEETMEPNLLETYRREEKGIPIGTPASINLSNNHAQYIFTWYSLSLATSVMLWMVVRKPSSDIARRVRRSRDWN